MATGPSSDTLRDQAGATMKEVSRGASAKIDEKKDSAAGGIGDFADALRKAGNETDGAGRFANFAADHLERVSHSLRSKNLDTLLSDAESLGRRQPVAFFAAAVAAGFLAVRFLKSSQRPSDLPTPSGD
jgi:hypothetical protein